MAWREDNRRKPTATQFMNVAGAVLGASGQPAVDGVLAEVEATASS